MITISLCTSFLFLLDIFAILRKPSLTFFDSDNDIVYFRISRAIQSFYRLILGFVLVFVSFTYHCQADPSSSDSQKK